MRFLKDYIDQFETSSDKTDRKLAKRLKATKMRFDAISTSGTQEKAFRKFVARYNWLGQTATKHKYNINQNFARNLPGALMQDFLLNLATLLCAPYPELHIFTEVKVAFGSYPIWENGKINFKRPAEKSDLAVGYILKDGVILKGKLDTPNEIHYGTKLKKDELIIPLITMNSKIRVSQSEFFDWFGREQLMTKGNPHCLSIQVALRKEMDISIVEASQATDKFFLLGNGNEGNVKPDICEFERLLEHVKHHLNERMS